MICDYFFRFSQLFWSPEPWMIRAKFERPLLVHAKPARRGRALPRPTPARKADKRRRPNAY